MGPLAGVRIIELVGIGPGPFVGMMLADMGAEVIAIDRSGKSAAPQLKVDIHRRGKKSIVLDLKSAAGKTVLFDLCESVDAIFEGFRPGVVEKLGIGPDDCMARNARLVYGRMTGWGQTGPLSQSAGHDLNYLSITGALHAMGTASQAPSPPLNLVGDYGGGMFLAFGLVSAILNARATGKGQIVDAAMADGVNTLMGLFHSFRASDMWAPKRESNLLDGGAPYYRCYETSDGKYISLGAIEYPFMKVFVEKTNAPEAFLLGHKDPSLWPELRLQFAAFFKTKTQQAWCDLLEGSDACFAPIVPFWEAAEHPHNKERDAFISIDGITQPAPSPRFSDTVPTVNHGPAVVGADTVEILKSLAYDDDTIAGLMG